jgi:hypothetical protein
MIVDIVTVLAQHTKLNVLQHVYWFAVAVVSLTAHQLYTHGNNIVFK